MAELEQNDVVLCASCGYDLRGISHSRCPECGLTITQQGVLRVSVEFEHVRAILRRGRYLTLLTWLAFLAAAMTRGTRWKHESGMQLFGGVTGLFVVLLLAAVSVYLLLDGVTRYPRIRQHLSDSCRGVIAGNVVTNLGLLVAPLLAILLMRSLLR